MNDELLPPKSQATIESSVPPSIVETPQQAIQETPPSPIVPLLVTNKDVPEAEHADENVRQVSETTPEPVKPNVPEAHQPRLKVISRYAARVIGSALDRAMVLLIALAILGGLKHIASACGLQIP